MNLAVFGSMNSVELGSIPHKSWRQQPAKKALDFHHGCPRPSQASEDLPEDLPKDLPEGPGVGSDGFINDVASD